MAKEDKYIVLAVGLPVIAMVFILLAPLKTLPSAITAVVMLALLLPSPVLIYLAKREVFKPTAPKVNLVHGAAVAENVENKEMRNLAIGLRIVGAPLVLAGWQIISNTTRVWYYALAGIMVLVGVILIGASVGVMKAVKEA